SHINRAPGGRSRIPRDAEDFADWSFESERRVRGGCLHTQKMGEAERTLWARYGVSEGGDVDTWIFFNALVILLTLDLVLLQRRRRGVSTRSALWGSAVWIVLALIFNVGIYFVSGKERALEFLTVYLVEKALSIDNAFVFLIIFAHF